MKCINRSLARRIGRQSARWTGAPLPPRSRSTAVGAMALPLVVLGIASGGGCRKGARSAAPPPAPLSMAAPAADRGGELCADVATLRVCWGERPALEPRALPDAPAPSAMGWRCAGQGQARTCVDRRAGAPGFSCQGSRCTQRHPRMPDDGEWSCADSAGATVCVGGERPAGVAPAPADPAWICGTRRGAAARAGGPAEPGGPAGPAEPGRSAAELGTRVCVDLSPDFPDGAMPAWTCRTLHDPPVRRICERSPAARTLAAPCDDRRPCVDGSTCVRPGPAAAGWCVPRRPSPDCWLDADCPSRRCRFGTCAVGDEP